MEYVFSFNKDAEIWYGETYNTREECLKAAEREALLDERQEVVYIGQCAQWIPCIDGRELLEDLAEEAYEETGEVAEEWRPGLECDCERLSRELTEVLHGWLIENVQYPSFYAIKNVKEYELFGRRKQNENNI